MMTPLNTLQFTLTVKLLDSREVTLQFNHTVEYWAITRRKENSTPDLMLQSIKTKEKIFSSSLFFRIELKWLIEFISHRIYHSIKSNRTRTKEKIFIQILIYCFPLAYFPVLFIFLTEKIKKIKL